MAALIGFNFKFFFIWFRAGEGILDIREFLVGSYECESVI